MTRTFDLPFSSRHLSRTALSVVASCFALAAVSAHAADPSGASALKSRFTELSAALAHNPYKRPLVMNSSESGSVLKGDIYATVDHPFVQVEGALSGSEHWCDVLMLHLNTKFCQTDGNADGAVLDVRIGKKYDQPIEDAHRVNFTFRQGAATPDYFVSRLEAKKGPLGTSDYRIALEAAPVMGNKTFIHLTYSYAYGFASKLAMQGYLATVGSDKVGFSSVRRGDGTNELIGGMRGVVERNTMRYYLAIDAYLNALSAPPAEQLDKRLAGWFAATEEFPRQLHELDRTEYMTMKRNEVQREKAPAQ